MEILDFTIKSDFTDEDLIGCVEREIAMRESVYHHRVTAGKMSLETAKREIDMMKTVGQIVIAYFVLDKTIKTANALRGCSNETMIIQTLKTEINQIKKYADKSVLADAIKEQAEKMSQLLELFED